MDRQNASNIEAVDYTAPPRHPGIGVTFNTQGAFLAGYTIHCKPPLNLVFVDLVAMDETRMNYSDRPKIHIEMPVDVAHLKQVAREFEEIAHKLLGIAETIEDEEFEQAETADALTLPEVA